MSAFLTENPRKRLLLEIFALLFIVLIAALVRYPNLGVNPGWYSDEGMLVDIANHLNNGEVQYMALKGPLLMVGRPPLFVNLLALAFRLAGPGILTLRILTATLGIISVVMLYLMIRGCLGEKGIPLAFLSALMLTLSPMAILYSRVAFSYSLLTPLVLLTMLASWKYANTGNHRWLSVAALAVGIGLLSDFTMLTILVPVLIVVLIHRWRDIFLVLGIALLPILIYFAILLISQPDESLFDLIFLLNRSKGLSLTAYIPAWIMNFGLLLEHDHWFLPALVGVFILKPVRFGQFSLLFWAVPMIIMARSLIVAGIGYYYASPLLPIISLGLGSLVLFGIPRISELTREAVSFLLTKVNHMSRGLSRGKAESVIKVISSVVITAIVLFPMVFYYFNSLYQVNTHLASNLDGFMVDPTSGIAAVEFVNSNVTAEELVIASPALAWALDCRTADFQMALVIDGTETIHFPPGVLSARFAYDTHLVTARFVILDPVWENFGITSIPEVAEMAELIRNEWVLVFEEGDIQVFENPGKLN
jgi:4-amino-4-deoxy-L-arabinose transferase-like glycosyltransferase